MDSLSLHAKQINHGQSEIWLGGAHGQEMTPRRTLTTNEVLNVTRRHCSPEQFEAFYNESHVALGHIASLNVPNLNENASELRLRIAG
jgi:hypothetical protein